MAVEVIAIGMIAAIIAVSIWSLINKNPKEYSPIFHEFG